jgi:hypothetical protein
MATQSVSQGAQTADAVELSQLKNRWSIALDEALRTGAEEDVERAVAMWTEDAHLDLGAFGVFDGRGSVARFLAESSRMFAWTRHFLTNPVLETDGDQASGRWYVQLYALALDAHTPDVMLGVHRDRYVRLDGSWRLKDQVTELFPVQ